MTKGIAMTKLLMNTEDVVKHLEHNNPELAQKIKFSAVKIEIGERDWLKSHYPDDVWERISFPLVFSLTQAVPRANNFKIFYDQYQDFHHVSFILEKEIYDINWYKVFVCTRGSDGKKINFGFNQHDIPPFFGSGEYKISPHWYKT